MASMPTATPSAGPSAGAVSGPSTQYAIKRSFWGGHLDIMAADTGQRIFHVNMISFAVRKPSMIVHSGSSTLGPVVAACKFKSFSADIDVGLGDLAQPSSMKWERLTHAGTFSPRWTFRVAVGGRHPQSFTWKKTHSMGTGSSGNWKLVNEQTQSVLAVFTLANGITRRACELNIYSHDYGEQFNFMVVLTGTAMYVGMQRGGGGGGGGGGA
ncbi:hypothetical protein N7492_006106 [Penicillium capsulatum]|uniref:Uncharacterized protein n=1 Tax=Penicillium capsulatum TaxID=69766 RepID=A0A9W9I0U3_9EURO|nr:hypothetical protein N7492_006106 [Penicillium capsulatum]KAJ6108756.1 hypothetical protein N7512_008593 [Penicillium capsulatum]